MTKSQKYITLPALGLLVLAGGTLAGATGIASAQTPDTGTTVGTAQETHGTFDMHRGGHVGKNGFKEEVLTGDTASKVTAAALAALPGATIDRAETDAEGAVYEAHMTKADGSHATLKFDANYQVTATEDGPGAPQRGN